MCIIKYYPYQNGPVGVSTTDGLARTVAAGRRGWPLSTHYGPYGGSLRRLMPSLPCLVMVVKWSMHHWTLHRHCTLHVLLAFSALTRLDTSRPNPGVLQCVFVDCFDAYAHAPRSQLPIMHQGIPSLWSVRHGCFDTLAGPVYVLHAHRLSVIPFLLLLCHRRPHRKR
jgi:hypothetical protein